MVAHAEALTNQVLQLLCPTGCGLEVAPYFDPFIHKKDHPQLYYTDYCCNEQLVEKARHNPSYIEGSLPRIDFVWRPGQALRACVPLDISFDYAVASHVLEHVPNPIGWMNQVLDTMPLGGRFALFLPDRRANLDRDRNLTTFGELVGLWAAQPSVPTPAQVADFLAHTVDLDPEALCAGKPGSSHYRDDEVVSLTRHVAETGQYIDAHCTVWEPQSFVAVIERVCRAGLMDVEISQTVDDHLEFAVVLTKRGEPRLRPPARPALESRETDVAAMRDLLEVRAHEMLFHQREAQHNILHRLNILIERDRSIWSRLLGR